MLVLYNIQLGTKLRVTNTKQGDLNILMLPNGFCNFVTIIF